MDGKVAFVTGAARGQGRSHAVRLAEEGASIIAVDILENYDSFDYQLGTEEEMATTVAQVEALGRPIIARKVDVRDALALTAVVDEGVKEFGHLDVVCANAGICTIQAWDDVSPEVWTDTVDTILTGTWNTMVATVPHLMANGGGSIICTGSTAAIGGVPYVAPYVAAKHGVVGIARGMAIELAPHSIRVNTIHPTGVDTPLAGYCMEQVEKLTPTAKDQLSSLLSNLLPVDLVDPRDVSNAVLFLASDESRYVTGLEFKVDAGNTL